MNKKRCQFDHKDGCHAFVCYSNKECGNRDEEGNPQYKETSGVRKEARKDAKIYCGIHEWPRRRV